MNVALVYDRVNKWGGAERVLLALHEMFPDAPLYTAVYTPNKAKWARVFPKVIPSFLQRVPYLSGKHQLLGSFTPIAFETFDFTSFDLVISVTSEAAKGIITNPETYHICYCLTPTRYLYSAKDYYEKNPPKELRIPLYKIISKPFIGYVSKWDNIASTRADKYIAISTEIKDRIRKYYGRKSDVVYPPVDIDFFSERADKSIKSNYFLMVTRLEAYKRVDLAIKAFNRLKYPLFVIGEGGDVAKLRRNAKKNIKFLGLVSDYKLRNYYQKAKGLIFPQVEDFGIVAVESIASGTPVIAYQKGGVKDIVINGINGIYFNQQTEDSLCNAIKKFDNMEWNRKEMRDSILKFDQKNFKKEFLKYLPDNV